MRLVTPKGPITKPMRKKVNIVTTFVTKIRRYRDNYYVIEIGLCLMSLTEGFSVQTELPGIASPLGRSLRMSLGIRSFCNHGRFAANSIVINDNKFV